MTDTDLDIILAVADGRLTGQAKQEALARIAADPELGEELASQIAAMDELKSLEPALMTPTERAALRSALVEQLNLQPAAPVIEIQSRRRPWWQPALGLASAAALLIAIVIVPSMFSSGDDSSANLVAVAPEASTSVDTVTKFDSGGTEDAVTESSGASPDAAVLVVPRIDSDDVQDYFGTVSSQQDEALGTTTEADDGVDEADSTTSILSEEPLTPVGGVEIDAGSVAACLADLGDSLPQGELVPLAATLDDDRVIVHFGVNAGGQVTYEISIVLDTCTITP